MHSKSSSLLNFQRQSHQHQNQNQRKQRVLNCQYRVPLLESIQANLWVLMLWVVLFFLIYGKAGMCVCLPCGPWALTLRVSTISIKVNKRWSLAYACAELIHSISNLILFDGGQWSVAFYSLRLVMRFRGQNRLSFNWSLSSLSLKLWWWGLLGAPVRCPQ